MSIYNQYADKPWMRPPMYTNDADPSHGTGVGRTTELVNGEAVVVDGREHYQPTEFGDGRPDPNRVDRSPMVYRGPDTAAVIDLDDHDELDTAPPQYVPVAAAQQAPQSTRPTVEEFANMPYRPYGTPTAQVAAPTPHSLEPTLAAGELERLQKDLARTPRPQLMTNPYPGQDPRRHPKLIVDMHGVSAPPGFAATAVVSIGNTLLCEADAEDLKLAANFFTAWAKMLSTIRN